MPRYRLRTLLIAVALLAIGLWAANLWKISMAHQLRAEQSRFHAIKFEDALHHLEKTAKYPLEDPSSIYFRRSVDRERRMYEKYEYAARHPWLPVKPDPPEPK